MTHDEIKEAGHKFCGCLEANGSRVVSMSIGLPDAHTVFFGEPDMLEESLFSAVAQNRGLILVQKP